MQLSFQMNLMKRRISMLRYRKTLSTGILIISLLVFPLSALAQTAEISEKTQNSPEAMTVDLVLARPIGLAATIIGSVAFVISLPFSASGGNIPEAWDNLVVAPAQYTFHRPLGAYDQETRPENSKPILD